LPFLAYPIPIAPALAALMPEISPSRCGRARIKLSVDYIVRPADQFVEIEELRMVLNLPDDPSDTLTCIELLKILKGHLADFPFITVARLGILVD